MDVLDGGDMVEGELFVHHLVCKWWWSADG